MLHNDIINPLVDDFITRVTGQGLNYFNGNAITRINDFIDYLCSIAPDRKFGFYPLRPDQNIGIGNIAFGIGDLASGSPMKFPGVAQWRESGVIFGSKYQASRFSPIYETVGIIDFSGNVEGGFQFRKDESTIFYFLKHLRPNEYARDLYRGTQICPYFVCDQSPDWFQVIAPSFSESRFRPQGTTYIYDEIFGEDKKGYQMDWSEKETTKYYGPQSISYYDPEVGSTKNRFYCYNINVNFSTYQLRSFFARDPQILSGNFIDPYVRRQTSNDVFEYDLPRRITVGAGCTNLATKVYNLDGLDHIVPGILIMKGDYSHLAKDIATNMGLTIGVLDEQFPAILSGLTDSANNIITPNINSLDYYRTFPIEYKNYPVEYAQVRAAIQSIVLQDFGKWEWVYDPLLCGSLGCFGGWPGRSPLEISEIRAQATTGIYITGNQVTGTFGSIRLGESLSNNGIIGFRSGYIDISGNFSGFNPNTTSGYSGFYYSNNTIQFPPYRKFSIDKITGYISGIMNSNYIFRPFNQFESNYGSGYFIDGNQIDFAYTGSIKIPISGFQSGYMDLEDGWSGYDLYNINSSSGYFINQNFYEFLPKKIINQSPITGFWIGFMNGFGVFSGYQTGLGDVSGILLTNNLISNDPMDRYYYPLGSNFIGFNGVDGIDFGYGTSFSGFFIASSGFSGYDQQNPFLGEGEMTGVIGYRNVLDFSGTFLGSASITGLDDGYGLDYSGFFIGNTGFSGIEYDPLANEYKKYGTGILYGYIGTKNILQYYTQEGFDNRSGFNTEDGYRYTGFSFPEGSGFIGINNQPTGSGVLTGFIGSRNFVSYTGFYSGFSGFLENYNQYLPRNIFANFQFTRGSGFIGSTPGYGLLTGIISTGFLDGEVCGYVDPKITSSLYITGNEMLIINLTGIVSGNFDYSYSSITGNVTGVTYTLAIIDGGTFSETGISGAFVSGIISNVNYLTGFLSIGSGTGDIAELETGFRFESGNITATVSSAVLTEAIAITFVTENGIPENGYIYGNVSSINYSESTVPTGIGTETGNMSGTISSINHYTYLVNSFTGYESGNYSVSGIFRINTGAFPVTGESLEYSISANYMVVPLFNESTNYNISGISMIV